MVTDSVPAVVPFEFNALSATVIGAVPGFDSANRVTVVEPAAGAFGLGTEANGSIRIRSGENPLENAPPSGTVTSALPRSTMRAWAVTACGVVTTTKPCLPVGVDDVSCVAQRTISTVGAPLFT